MNFVKRDDFVDEEYHPYPAYTTNELADKTEAYFNTFFDGGELTEIDGRKVEHFWRCGDGRRIMLVHLHDVDVQFYCDVPMITEGFGEGVINAVSDYPELFMPDDTKEYLPIVVRAFRTALGL